MYVCIDANFKRTCQRSKARVSEACKKRRAILVMSTFFRSSSARSSACTAHASCHVYSMSSENVAVQKSDETFQRFWCENLTLVVQANWEFVQSCTTLVQNWVNLYYQGHGFVLTSWLFKCSFTSCVHKWYTPPRKEGVASSTHGHILTHVHIELHTRTDIFICTFTCICMYIYIYICIYIYMYIYIYIHIYVYIYIHMYVHICMYKYIYICTYKYICIWIYTHIYLHTYVFVYMNIYMYMYQYTKICICIYI